MTQPTYPQQPPPNYPGAPLPPKSKRFGWLAAGIIAVGGLLVGSILGVLGASGGGTTAAPAATATATKLVTVYAHPSESTPTSAPTSEPTGFTPHKSDFVIGLKILKKTCFGSAGCNIDYRIKPAYVGSQTLPDTGTIEVTYRVTGGDEGANENTFTIEGGTVSYDKTESTGTASSGAKLKVKVTDVSYDG